MKISIIYNSGRRCSIVCHFCIYNEEGFTFHIQNTGHIRQIHITWWNNCDSVRARRQKSFHGKCDYALVPINNIRIKTTKGKELWIQFSAFLLKQEKPVIQRPKDLHFYILNNSYKTNSYNMERIYLVIGRVTVLYDCRIIHRICIEHKRTSLSFHLL